MNNFQSISYFYPELILTFVIERTIRSSISSQANEEQEINISQKTNQYRIGTAFAGTASGILGIGGGAILVTLNLSLIHI